MCEVFGLCVSVSMSVSLSVNLFSATCWAVEGVDCGVTQCHGCKHWSGMSCVSRIVVYDESMTCSMDKLILSSLCR